QDAFRDYATGGKYQHIAQSASAAIAGLANGDFSGAVAGAAAPFIATFVKKHTDEDSPQRILAHALAGAVIAKAQGKDALAGAAGASTGEMTAKLALDLYGKKPEQLGEDERQLVSALSSVAAGLAGAAVSDNTASVQTAAQAGKNAVENNAFNLAGRSEKEYKDKVQKQADGVDLQKIYGGDEEKIEAYRKGRAQGATEGLKEGAVEAVEGAVNTILHPVDTVTDLASTIWNYEKTYDAIKISVTEWNDLLDYALVNDPELAGEMVGSTQGKITGNTGASFVLSGAAAKLVQKAARMESNVRLLPDIHGKEHPTYVKGDVTIPVSKVEVWLRGGAKGDMDVLVSRLKALKDEQIADQRAFAKSGKEAEIKTILKNINNIERSRVMADNLIKAGFENTGLNNSILMEKLVRSAKDVDAENPKSTFVIKGSDLSVRINAIWAVLPDGTKRLATLTTGTFKE
ncbi:VENN motif pre-toxin domain-containing protein, partial [Cronobacter muytjensii]|uniref:VENN motif pre-toxin domain-containing protein n=1 Tax=Cronobacter muytjensii TaxID=413501 RepID=UPI0024A8A9C6